MNCQNRTIMLGLIFFIFTVSMILSTDLLKNDADAFHINRTLHDVSHTQLMLHSIADLLNKTEQGLTDKNFTAAGYYLTLARQELSLVNSSAGMSAIIPEDEIPVFQTVSPPTDLVDSQSLPPIQQSQPPPVVLTQPVQPMNPVDPLSQSQEVRPPDPVLYPQPAEPAEPAQPPQPARPATGALPAQPAQPPEPPEPAQPAQPPELVLRPDLAQQPPQG